MHRKFVILVLLMLGLAAPSLGADRSEYFVGFNVGKSLINMDSSGHSWEGFKNSGDDTDSSMPIAEVVVGKLCGPWRTELSFSGRSTTDFKTESYRVTPLSDTWADQDIKEDETTVFSNYTEVSNRTLMLSTYYDFSIGGESRWMPYIGAGIGASINKMKFSQGSLSENERDTEFAWQAGAGFSYKMSDKVDMLIGYRYVDLGDSETKYSIYDDVYGYDEIGNFKASMTSNEIILGLRIILP